MTKRLAVVILLSMLTTVLIAAGEAKRYPIQSGIIEYTLSGNQSGTETIYFDQWGMREARHANRTVDMGGVKMPSNTISIMNHDWIYQIDLNMKTGNKIPNTILKDMLSQSPDQDLTQVGEEMLRKMGSVKKGTEVIAGKTCDIWETPQMNMVICIWNGIALRSEMQVGAIKMTSVASQVEENVPVPETKFEIPSGIQVTESPDMAAMFAGAPPPSAPAAE